MEQQMYKVQIDGEERSFPAGTTYLQIAGEYQERYPHDIVLVYVNGKLQELGKKLKKDCTLHFVTTGETIGNLTYRRGVSFLLVKAVYDTIGHDKIEQVRIHFSVDKGYYCTIKEIRSWIRNCLQGLKNGCMKWQIWIFQSGRDRFIPMKRLKCSASTV